MPRVHPDYKIEQTHLTQTIQAMIKQIDRWEDPETISGADLETSLTMQDTAREHAAMLSVHLDKPYFGSMQIRIAGKEQELYIGKHAFGHPECSVVAWESDVGSLFYSQETEWIKGRRKGNVFRKRQLEIEKRQLQGITDLYSSEEKVGKKAGKHHTQAKEEVLIRRLSEGSTTGMRDVVETLTEAQNNAVRAQAGESFLITGAAGSGKTTIAFHRLAWLASLERGDKRIDPARCLVLMPNKVLASYATRILPELGLEKLSVTTPEEWAKGFLGLEKMEITDRTLQLLLQDTDNNRRRAAWYRGLVLSQLKLKDVVARYLKEKIENKAKKLNFSPEEMSRLTGILERLPLQGIYKSIQEAGLNIKCASGILPVSDSRRLLSDEKTLRECAQGILDEREILSVLSDPLSAYPKPKGASTEITELPVTLCMSALMTGIGLKSGKELLAYDHCVLDEAQDYSPLLYFVLARAVQPGGLTLLGDNAQNIHGYKAARKWQEVQEAAQIKADNHIHLNVSYRSTQEISEVARKVAKQYSKNKEAQSISRSGQKVQFFAETSSEKMIEVINKWQEEGLKNIALICRRAQEAENLSEMLKDHDINAASITSEQQRYKGGVLTITVQLSKGLEFDAAIVIGADEQHYQQVEFESRLLYVALTRGMHALAIQSEQKLHPFLQEA